MEVLLGLGRLGVPVVLDMHGEEFTVVMIGTAIALWLGTNGILDDLSLQPSCTLHTEPHCICETPMPRCGVRLAMTSPRVSFPTRAAVKRTDLKEH
jgi:hypothetical protein